MKTIFKSTPLFRRTFLLFTFALLSLSAASAAPQNPPQTSPAAPTATVTEVARELICDCPDCGKQALDQCGKCEVGQKYRDAIAAELKQGKSKAQVISYMATTYGGHMLGNPSATGFNRSALLMPALAVLLGIVPLGLALARRKTVKRGTPKNDEPPLATPEDERVSAALRDLDN